MPPRHPKHEIPVVPMRINGFLIFATCRMCVQQKIDQNIDNEYNCPHFDDRQRGFSTTLTTIELAKALEADYRITRLYRAYHWDDWSNDLFHPYLRKFMELKYLSEGWPSDCQEEGVENDELMCRKQKYIDEAFQRYQINLDSAKIAKNSGMRYLAKLGLNSLWGR